MANLIVSDPSDIPKPDRPREKLLAKGASALSDLELMAVLLGSGTQSCDVLAVAGRILKAIVDRASAIIVAHNHPAGTLSPSAPDREAAQRLKEAGELLGIPLLDHIIFNHKGYYSFLEHENF